MSGPISPEIVRPRHVVGEVLRREREIAQAVAELVGVRGFEQHLVQQIGGSVQHPQSYARVEHVLAAPGMATDATTATVQGRVDSVWIDPLHRSSESARALELVGAETRIDLGVEVVVAAHATSPALVAAIS